MGYLKADKRKGLNERLDACSPKKLLLEFSSEGRDDNILYRLKLLDSNGRFSLSKRRIKHLSKLDDR